MTRRPLLALLALPVVLAVAGCAPGTPAPTSSGTSPASEPSASSTPHQEQDVDYGDDALLVVQAVATSGAATMDLLLVVRQSTAWDDPAAADRPATFTAGCSGAYDESIYASDLFSFTAIDVSASPTGGTWPADHGVWVFPDTEFTSLASTGFLVKDPAASSETPNCKRMRLITGGGEGQLIVGLHGDTDAVGAAGGFTRWANHNYGFTAQDTAVTLSDCAVTVTPLGAESGWDAETAESVVESDICRYGVIAGQDQDS